MKQETTTFVNCRFAGIEQSQLLVIAIILHPSFKDKFFSSSIIRATVRGMLEEELLKIKEVVGNPGRKNYNATTTPPCSETEEPPSEC